MAWTLQELVNELQHEKKRRNNKLLSITAHTYISLKQVSTQQDNKMCIPTATEPNTYHDNASISQIRKLFSPLNSSLRKRITYLSSSFGVVLFVVVIIIVGEIVVATIIALNFECFLHKNF